MKEQTWVTGSLNPNTINKTDLQANNAWNPLEVLKAGDLDGMLKKDSEQLKIVSDEIANFITATGATLDPTDSTQLATAIGKIKNSSLQFVGYVATTEPSSSTYSLVEGNLWINSATMPTSFPVSASDIKVWSGTAWVNATSGYTPQEFETFRNINNGEGYYWFGGVWKVMSTDMSTDYFVLNQSTGLWEIKTGVELNAPELVASPSANVTGHEIVDANWVINQSSKEGIKYMTNCITEIPQDVELELNNGVLTLKAGSKLYVPNGIDSYEIKTFSEDVSVSSFGTFTGQAYITYGIGAWSSAAGFDHYNLTGVNIFASASQPSNPMAGNNYWWDLTNNVIKTTSDSGATWVNSTITLPFAIISVSSGTITSIDKVFNGFGYLASTVFVLPGVKGLIPDGKNENGSLKNISMTFSSPAIYTITNTTDNLSSIFFADTEENLYWIAVQTEYYVQNQEPFTPASNKYGTWYNPDTNIIQRSWNNEPWHKVSWLEISRVIFQTGVMKSLSGKNVFRYADYNDYKYEIVNALPSSPDPSMFYLIPES